jgi:hypothetical protein
MAVVAMVRPVSIDRSTVQSMSSVIWSWTDRAERSAGVDWVRSMPLTPERVPGSWRDGDVEAEAPRAGLWGSIRRERREGASMTDAEVNVEQLQHTAGI